MLHALFSIVSYQYAVSIVRPYTVFYPPSISSLYSFPRVHAPNAILHSQRAPCRSPHLMCTRPFSHAHSVLCHSLLLSPNATLHKTPFTPSESALFYYVLALLPPHRTYFPDSVSHASPFPCHFLFLKLYFTGCTHCTHHSLKLTLHSPHP